MTPPKDFTTCAADADEVAKLQHPAGLMGTSAQLQQATAATARWYDLSQVPPTMGNSALAYVYGRCAFVDIATALATATTAEHRIYLTGWGTDPDTVLLDNPPLTLRTLLSSTEAQIRALLWDNFQTHQDPGLAITSGSNVAMAKFVNSLPNGAAILDHKLPELHVADTSLGQLGGGVHHQKLVVVRGQLGLIAFAGGMDLNPSRVHVGGTDPLHDVHVRVTGKAAASVLRILRDRWTDHPDTPAADSAKFSMTSQQVDADFDAVARAQVPTSLPTSTAAGRAARYGGSHAVAVGRTFANLGRLTNPKQTYAFAPGGDRTAWDLVSTGITRARQHIYIEDQYFVSRRLARLLVDKVRDPKFEFLLIIMEKSSSFEHDPELTKDGGVPNEIPFLIGARNEIRAALAAADPKQTKWRMFTLTPAPDPARAQWCGPYLHSKTIICDDDYVTTGSTNANDRGYTFDSEVVLGITDDPLGRVGGGRFAGDLRVKLWHKHLGVPHAQVADWRTGLGLWLKPPQSAMVTDASALEDSPMLGPKAILKDHPAEDRFWRETIDPDADAMP